MTSTRALNMQKRRERILTQARKVISARGFDSLNLRDLAEVSNVTVPTIYNLIGSKEEVLKALMMGAFEDFDAEMKKKPPAPASQLPAVMITTLVDMISKNEEFYRATALAGERVELEERENYGLKRVPLRKLAGKLCQQALSEGLLKGDIHADTLIELMVASHQVAFRDWAHRMASLQELANHSLRGFYIALAADATDSFRAEIVMRLKNI